MVVGSRKRVPSRPPCDARPPTLLATNSLWSTLDNDVVVVFAPYRSDLFG